MKLQLSNGVAAPISFEGLNTLEIAIEGDELVKRNEIVNRAKDVEVVNNDFTQDLAVTVLRELRELSQSVEETRTLLKKPVLELGRRIDRCAGGYLESVENERKRVGALLDTYTTDLDRKAKVARENAEAEANRIEAERQKALLAQQAATTAEAANAATKEVKQLEQKQMEILTAPVPAVRKVEGTKNRDVWVWEEPTVDDLVALVKAHPQLCSIELRVLELNKFLNGGGKITAGLRNVRKESKTIV